MNVTIERKRTDCNALPKGWQREEVLRKSGLSTGKVDVYYYSPLGLRIDSKSQLMRHLGDTMDLTRFDYQSGHFISHGFPQVHGYQRSNAANIQRMLVQEASSMMRQHQHQIDYSRGVRSDISLVPPIRQTASIFKQPVTVYRKYSDSKQKSDLKHGIQEKPKQVFWEKRLEGLRACDPTGSEFSVIQLPKGLKAVGPEVDNNTLLQSVATALHVSSAAVTGQTEPKAALQTNSGVFLNPDQPLMYSINVTEDDIRKQEERVQLARQRLQEVLDA